MANVLVACEESQEVCKAFRAHGHEAYSCDLQPCSGGRPEWHINGDCLPLLNGYCHFITEGGTWVIIPGKWDLIIAHPPCTYLTVTGNRWFNVEEYGKDAEKRWRDRVEAAVFFMRFVAADCDRVAIENPIGIIGSVYRKADQIIQPWQFAIDESEQTEKATCLWLKGLPKLKPTHRKRPNIKYHVLESGKRQTEWYYKTRCLPHDERAVAASKSFKGISEAMAQQWGSFIEKGVT